LAAGFEWLTYKESVRMPRVPATNLFVADRRQIKFVGGTHDNYFWASLDKHLRKITILCNFLNQTMLIVI
jgi:hypothetical protein